VSRSTDALRLIVSHSALVLNAESVIAVETLVIPGLPGELKAVRVDYRDDAPSGGSVESSPASRPQPDGVLPFALAVRWQSAQISDSPRYRALAASFMRRHGLIARHEPSDGGNGL
jgi:hypothetical protein